MVTRSAFALISYWSFLSLAAAVELASICDYDSCLSQNSVHRRQIPVIVAPPSTPRPNVDYTPLVPQPTPSLNYWWPYGSNGVNPTATPSLRSVTTSSADDDTSDDSATTMDHTTSRSSSSSSTSTPTATEAPHDAFGLTPIPDIPEFQVTSLLPLFIILGLIALATLGGWSYGRLLRWYQSRKQPVPDGASLGGALCEPKESELDLLRPVHSVGTGWVDASRIYDRTVAPEPVYEAVQNGRPNGEHGTPGKKKARTGWFRHTFSRKKKPTNEDSPSKEKGLDHLLAGIRAAEIQAVSKTIPSPTSTLESPRLLRMTEEVCSLATSIRPTSKITTSSHGYTHQMLTKKEQVERKEYLLAAPTLPGDFQVSDDSDDQTDHWNGFRAEPLKRSPARRYASGHGNKPSKPQTRSPDPVEHPARMRRLRAAAQAASVAPDMTSPSRDSHPLPPTSSTPLSPPLQPHLFFTGAELEAVSRGDTSPLVRYSHARKNRSGTKQPIGDPFGPSVSRHFKGGKKLVKRHLGMTPTAPLSPELRGAAMNRFEEIVKTSWSTRNLAGIPQSPTLYGALGPSHSRGFHLGDDHEAELERLPMLDQPSDREEK